MTAGEPNPIRLPLNKERIPILLVNQTPRTASEHMKRELIKFPKWQKKGYTYNYGPPHHQIIDELIKSDISNVDWDKIQLVVENEIHPHFDFEPAEQSVTSAMPEVDKALSVFETYHQKWGFKLFPRYEIELVVGTIGGGGSWQTVNDIDGGIPNGVITFWQNPDLARRGRTPAERIVHEMVHIGIEELLTQICKDVGKPVLHQKTKERLVDLIVQKAFQRELFPNYHMQKNQDERIDSYITEVALLDLPTAIRSFITENEPYSECTIRQYKRADEEKARNVSQQALKNILSEEELPLWHKDFNRIVEEYIDNNGDFLVAEVDGKIVGIAGFRKKDNITAEIRRMRTLPEYQRKGIGKKLLIALEESIKEKGYKKIILDTSSRMTGAVKLCSNMGYNKTESRDVSNYQEYVFEKVL